MKLDSTLERLRLSRVIIKLAPINCCVLIRTAAFTVHGCAKWLFPCYLICGLNARRVLTLREMSKRLLLQNYIISVSWHSFFQDAGDQYLLWRVTWKCQFPCSSYDNILSHYSVLCCNLSARCSLRTLHGAPHFRAYWSCRHGNFQEVEWVALTDWWVRPERRNVTTGVAPGLVRGKLYCSCFRVERIFKPNWTMI